MTGDDQDRPQVIGYGQSDQNIHQGLRDMASESNQDGYAKGDTGRHRNPPAMRIDSLRIDSLINQDGNDRRDGR